MQELWRLILSDDDGPPIERRIGLAEIVAQIASLRQLCAGHDQRLAALNDRIEVVSRRTHDLATPLAVLVDGAERAERHHGEMMAEIKATRVEAVKAMSDHDARDDKRFGEVGARLSLMDQLNAANEARRQNDANNEKQASAAALAKSTHRMMVLCAALGVGGAIIATIIPMLATHAGVTH